MAPKAYFIFCPPTTPTLSSVIAEEFGFIGTLVVLVLYAVVIRDRIAMLAKDMYGLLLAAGSNIFFFHLITMLA